MKKMYIQPVTDTEEIKVSNNLMIPGSGEGPEPGTTAPEQRNSIEAGGSVLV